MIIISLVFLFPICFSVGSIYYQAVNYGNVIWWSIPLSLFLGILAFALTLVVFLIFSLLLINGKHMKYYHFVIRQACAFLIFFFRIKITATGLEKIPKEENFFLVCNHLSNLDPVIQMYVLKKVNISYIMKKEIMAIPFIGSWLKKSGFLVLDRNNNRQAAEVMIEAIQKCKNNEYIGVFPEGTRSKDGELLPLKSGIFKVPQKANVQILITHLHGSNQIKRNYPFKRTHIYFEVLDKIKQNELEKMSTNEISDKITGIFKQKNEYYKKTN
ncbi:MAG: lysophospholipid acyltransferase family protein [Bacilli bacterium]|nr:lysophospholipid acyltransferase family protein [Bacilli bacterium]